MIYSILHMTHVLRQVKVLWHSLLTWQQDTKSLDLCIENQFPFLINLMLYKAQIHALVYLVSNVNKQVNLNKTNPFRHKEPHTDLFSYNKLLLMMDSLVILAQIWTERHFQVKAC